MIDLIITVVLGTGFFLLYDRERRNRLIAERSAERWRERWCQLAGVSLMPGQIIRLPVNETMARRMHEEAIDRAKRPPIRVTPGEIRLEPTKAQQMHLDQIERIKRESERA